MSDDVVRVRAIVRGRVQMVGFRAFVIGHASEARVHGTVRNLRDGTVECVVEGPGAAVEQVLAALRSGPAHARVDRVDVSHETPAGDLPSMMVTV